MVKKISLIILLFLNFVYGQEDTEKSVKNFYEFISKLNFRYGDNLQRHSRNPNVQKMVQNKKKILPILKKKLQSTQNRNVALGIASFMYALAGEEGLSSLQSLLKISSFKWKSDIINQIMSDRSKKAKDFLLNAIYSESLAQDEVWSVIYRLSAAGTIEIIPYLKKKLLVKDKDIARQAAYNLALFSIQKGVPLLIEELRERMEASNFPKGIRAAKLCEALGISGDPRAYKVLIDTFLKNLEMKSPDVAISTHSSNALKRIKYQLARSPLRTYSEKALKGLYFQDSVLRRNSGWFVSATANKKCIPYILKVLKDPNYNEHAMRIKQTLLLTLVDLKAKEVLPILKEKLKNAKSDIERLHWYADLGKLSDPAGIKHLRNFDIGKYSNMDRNSYGFLSAYFNILLGMPAANWHIDKAKELIEKIHDITKVHSSAMVLIFRRSQEKAAWDYLLPLIYKKGQRFFFLVINGVVLSENGSKHVPYLESLLKNPKITAKMHIVQTLYILTKKKNSFSENGKLTTYKPTLRDDFFSEVMYK